MPGIVTATRFWLGKQPDPKDSEKGLGKLREWALRAVEWSELVLIAVRTELDYGGSMETIESWGIDKVVAIEVRPWIGVSAALNALLTVGATYGESGADGHHFGGSIRNSYEYILYQSVEVHATPTHVQVLRDQLDKSDTYLMAGAKLPGHEFEVGTHSLTGTSCAWNTCAMWRIDLLGRTGFLSISDGIVPGAGPQIEEVICVSTLQAIGKDLKVFLINVPGVEWEVEFDSSPERIASHNAKMESKIQRANQQLAAMSIKPGLIEHVEMDAIYH